MQRSPVAAIAALAFIVASCRGGADQSPSIPSGDREIGAEQHPRLLAEFGGAYDARQARYVEALGERVAAAAGLAGECTFTLVNSDVVNAFAVPGCYIYVTRGLLALVTSEAELAAVIAHEVGHIVASHGRRQQRRSIWRTLGVIAVSLTGSERLTRLAGEAAQYFTLRYSRGQENEADDLGVQYLQRAGYDPYAAADMLATLGRQERFMAATGGRDAARGLPEWASSHPLAERRVARSLAAAEATGLADDELPEAAEGYLRAVDGLLYGDDPAQGFVIGRRFAHPVMRIAFEAPPGFTLTNSPQAIRITGPNARGEFGGGVLPRDGLEAYAVGLAARLLGDARREVGVVERVVIGGLPAVIVPVAVAVEGGTLPLTVAAYDAGGGQAYHFVMIAPPQGASARALAALFGSFRLMTPAEAARLRPHFVRVVATRPGETLATIARAMASDDPRALFLLLNGRTADQPIRPGEPVKLVLEARPGG